ncbi:hypothetical protein [Arthrobacter sp. TB 23]|uniref:hypothetical protein n=1 Tax=Arthrobacter sp. TB 23 TaxID=494419 RepID=UPI00178C45DA|nr:hypothetical protein [Arthrobacter sp. TB 23]
MNEHRIGDTENPCSTGGEQVPSAAVFGEFGGTTVMVASAGFDAQLSFDEQIKPSHTLDVHLCLDAESCAAQVGDAHMEPRWWTQHPEVSLRCGTDPGRFSFDTRCSEQTPSDAG